MTETFWFLLVVWIGLIALSRTNKAIGAFGSLLGMFFGIMLVTAIGFWVGIIIIGLNIYLLYDAILVEHPK